MLGDIVIVPITADVNPFQPLGIGPYNLAAGVPVELRKDSGGLSIAYRTFFHRPSTWLVLAGLAGAFYGGMQWQQRKG